MLVDALANPCPGERDRVERTRAHVPGAPLREYGESIAERPRRPSRRGSPEVLAADGARSRTPSSTCKANGDDGLYAVQTTAAPGTSAAASGHARTAHAPSSA